MKKIYPKRINPKTMLTRFEEICKVLLVRKNRPKRALMGLGCVRVLLMGCCLSVMRGSLLHIGRKHITGLREKRFL